MEQFDEMLKHMAEQEECIVPEGFDEKIRGTLDALPSKTKKGLGAVKGALVAAAVCAALLCTAFAASPGLRELLAEALGGFAPYAQEQDGQAYVIDGMEFRVVSALPPERRVVVTLFYYEDMGVEQIAKCLRVSQGTVKSRLSRARKQLKGMLCDEEGEYGTIR